MPPLSRAVPAEGGGAAGLGTAGPDVLTWFDLHTATTGPLHTVNWRHVENGKITAIRVTFDPRPLTSGS